MQANIIETDNVRRFRALFTNFERVEARIKRARDDGRSISKQTKSTLRNILAEFNDLVGGSGGSQQEQIDRLIAFRQAAYDRASESRAIASQASQTNTPHGLRSSFLASMRRILGRTRRPLAPDARASNILGQPSSY